MGHIQAREKVVLLGVAFFLPHFAGETILQRLQGVGKSLALTPAVLGWRHAVPSY